VDLSTQLIGFEGWARKAYPDPLTRGAPWTAGVGHCGPEVQPGTEWTDAQIEQWLADDIAEAERDVRALCPWFDKWQTGCAPRRAVLIGMAFQLGRPRLAQFRRFLAACRDEKFDDAANEMRDSQWSKQVPKRAARLARQMETGEWN
jgi:lysozyme